jgi:hypothetical protein
MCQVSQPGSGAEIRPAVDGNIYLYDYHGDLYNDHSSDPRYQNFTFDDNSVKKTLVKAPAHGNVEHVDTGTTTTGITTTRLRAIPAKTGSSCRWKRMASRYRFNT